MPPRCDETVFTPALRGEAQKEGISIGIAASGTYAGAQRVCAEAPLARHL